MTEQSEAGLRKGGSLTFIKNSHTSSSEQLEDLGVSNVDIEAQWIQIHRPHSKNIVICNLYRPPTGNLKKNISYLEDCFAAFTLDKTELFLLGDLNVDYLNKSSPECKKSQFCYSV